MMMPLQQHPAAHVGCRQRAHSRIALVRAAAKAAGRNGCLRRLFTSSNTAQPCTALPCAAFLAQLLPQ